ncbi:PepSY domain-containing protein [Novosphingobium sp. BW1]|uniref:PepSY-associated TM helix domain-containing protein n=1 Tax=Novosphingobium sp. BW1 TaxID=2592621 RepID=UPI0011DEB512|nr:PepSY-associated TM helix domain-containing protein [Novosphingobium sp. BW1]TYC94423.1 PepSY domain-containing protein [Novosphingobium sp. BW1]
MKNRTKWKPYALVRQAHRWAGGFAGLVLAVMGLSGALLAHRDLWVSLPHSDDWQVQDVTTLTGAVKTILANPDLDARAVFFASEDFGLNRVRMAGGAGAYTDQTGQVVAQWGSKWERPEQWLFDLHHYLLAGDTGETVAGVFALAGLLFVATGVYLWWPLRKTFKPRLLPKRLSRPAIIGHHRDLGALLSPLLFVSLMTASVMVFSPMTAVLFGPGAPATIAAAHKPPVYRPVPLASGFDWNALFTEAHRKFPDAEMRILTLPSGSNGTVRLHMRQPGEWLPNGRTILWFAADTGALIEARDAFTLPRAARGYDTLYPIHSGKTGSMLWRIAVTLSGLALGLLGLLAVWSFWFGGKRKPARKA